MSRRSNRSSRKKHKQKPFYNQHWFLALAAILGLIGLVVAIVADTFGARSGFQEWLATETATPTIVPTATLTPSPTATIVQTPVPTATATRISTITPTPEPALYIFSDEGGANYLIRGTQWQTYEVGDELVVYDVRVADAQIPIALLRVTSQTPTDLQTQAILLHENRAIEPNMTVAERDDQFVESTLIPSYAPAVAYLLEEGTIRLRPDTNIQIDNILHVWEPIVVDRATRLDYLPSETKVRVTAISGEGIAATVELVDEGANWPAPGTMFGRNNNEACNTLDPEIPLANEKEALIIVVRFASTRDEPSDFHDEIIERIQTIIDERGFDDVRVELDEIHQFEADEDALAQAVGDCYGAAVMLWGKEKTLNVDINFLNVREPDSNAGRIVLDEQEVVSQLVPPEQYQTFVLEDVPRQMSYLTLFAIGQSHYAQSDFSSAMPLIEEAVAQFVNMADVSTDLELDEAYFRLGYISQIKKKYADAIEFYGIALTLNPHNAFSYNNRGNVYDSLEQYEAALDDYNQSLAINPDETFIYYNRGNTFLRLKQYEAALNDYDQAIILNPINDSAYYNRGVAYQELEQLQKALDNYNKVVSLNPDFELVYNNRGIIFYDSGQYEAALNDYNQAIIFNPDNAYAYNNRGNVYADLTQYEAAIDDYNQAISLNPDYATAYYNRGWSYDEIEEYEAALDDYNQAISLNPYYRDAYNNRGLVYDRLEQYQEAIADYDQTIILSPNYALAYYNRGLTYFEIKQYDVAVVDFSRALELGYYSATTIYYWRGMARTHLNDWENASADFTVLTEALPTNALVWNVFCWSGTLLNHAEDVEIACENAVEFADKVELPRYTDNRGVNLALRGEYAAAIVDFQVFINAFQESPEMRPQINQRQEWIESLEIGKNPFGAETLEALLNE